jgi:DNA mismatch endonuclease, patch repair protein
MPDVFTKKKRSDVMSRIRSRGNKQTEIVLAKLLRRHHVTGWRRHIQIRGGAGGGARVCDPQQPRPVGGRPSFKKSRDVRSAAAHRAALRGKPAFRVRPDFIFRQPRVALFVDGCFWHGCPRHANLPVNNRTFWRKKLALNRARDLLVNRRLRQLGWRVLRLWEHELRDQPRCLQKIVRILATR